MKKILSCLLTLALTAALTAPLASAADYTDIPESSALAGEVRKAVEYGLMNGYSATKFGYSDSMTRAQFTAVLVRMMGWDMVTPETAFYTDVPAGSTWHSVIETARAHDVTENSTHFRPNDPITRGEMAELLVRALGLKYAAERLNSSTIPMSDAYSILHGSVPFTDLPEREEGYITVAYTIGMTKGTSATTFSPNASATRAQAAAMLVRIYEKLHRETDFVHGFYAISSYSQLSLTDSMDAVSAGWSRMTWDGETALLSTTGANNNEFAVPTGYDEVTERTGEKLKLSVFMEGDSLKAMLASANGRTQAVEQIMNELTVNYKAIGRNPYSGVTIDFEGLRAASKQDFTDFLTELRTELDRLDKTLYVCVSPVLSSGYYDGAWYNGYDYAAIGRLADKVILMAYDYEPRYMAFIGGNYYQYTASVPIDQVYLGLKALTNEVTPEKVALGFSCKNVAWQIDGEGKLISDKPVYLSNDTVLKRLAQKATEFGWSELYQQSYAVYDGEDGTRWFLWYQDGRSVETALNAAKLLGVTGVSVWRLGTIPRYSFGSREWNWNCLLA